MSHPANAAANAANAVFQAASYTNNNLFNTSALNQMQAPLGPPQPPAPPCGFEDRVETRTMRMWTVIQDTLRMDAPLVVKPVELTFGELSKRGSMVTIPGLVFETEAAAYQYVHLALRARFKTEVKTFIEHLTMAGLKDGFASDPEMTLAAALHTYLKDIEQ